MQLAYDAEARSWSRAAATPVSWTPPVADAGATLYRCCAAGIRVVYPVEGLPIRVLVVVAQRGDGCLLDAAGCGRGRHALQVLRCRHWKITHLGIVSMYTCFGVTYTHG